MAKIRNEIEHYHLIPNYAKDLADFKQAKQTSGDEHPLFATHVFIQVGDTTYEYYNGDTSNIDHIDCVEI
jgi:hypothetical protein